MKQSVKGLDLAKKLGISPLRGVEAVELLPELKLHKRAA